jgi:hypothetical protein
MKHTISPRQRKTAETADIGIGHPVLVAEPGWYVDCACGWGGNGPYATKKLAEDAGQQHQLDAAVDDERAYAVAEFLTADTAEQTQAAIARYNAAGRVTAG